ncbi:MAG: pilus assembly PilX N-terminal domain-containing protein, partial [Nitrospirales bacterium]
MNSSSLSKDNNQSDAQGIALVAALILMAVLSVIGATVLKATSTEIGISGNYRRGLEAFYLAEAGIAEGRVRLRGDITSNPQLVEDPTRYYDARWTAYILTSDSWKPA